MLVTPMLVAAVALGGTALVVLLSMMSTDVRRVALMRYGRIGMNSGHENSHCGEKGQCKAHRGTLVSMPRISQRRLDDPAVDDPVRNARLQPATLMKIRQGAGQTG